MITDLSLVQVIVALFGFIALTFLFLQSLFKRKKITLGTLETTILPMIVAIVLLLYTDFIALPLYFDFVGIAFLISSVFIHLLAYRKIFDNSDDFWFAKKDNKKRYLVREGVYQYIRHPIYTSMLLGYLGIILIFFNVFTLLLYIFAFLFIIWTAVNEEKFLVSKFNEYEKYKKKTGMFFPSFLSR